MKLEYRVWNVHEEWQSLAATTLEAAKEELEAMMPNTKEAKIRDVETGQVWDFKPKNFDED